MQLSPATYMFRLGLFLLVLILLDLYAFQGLKAALSGLSWGKWVRSGFWVLHGLFYVWVAVFFSGFLLGWKASPKFINFGVTSFALFYLPKLFLVTFVLIEDLYRGGRFGFENLISLFRTAPPETAAEGVKLISRSEFLQRAGVMVAAVPFLGLVYGAVKGKYDYMIRRVSLKIPGLPEGLNGFRLAQISDLHTGSLDNPDEVLRGIEMVNETGADLIVFTGDLVNNKSDEVGEYENILSQLKAPMGVYSILGNHDYGDYVRDWKAGEKEENFRQILEIHQRMGWRLLRDENLSLEKNGERISLIGVQNISGKANFHSYGNLAKAWEGSGNPGLKILLSHDPSHWDKEVRTSFPDIHLTLSGHTHGAQMGIEIPGWRFSPAQWIYKQWAGLYSEGQQHLYVNRGFGFIGYAGRMGIRPEITVIEFQRG